MIKSSILKLGVVFVFSTLTYISCTKDSKTDDNKKSEGFDKTAMLTNYADKLIIPAYEKTQQKFSILEQSIALFLETPNESNHSAIKTPFKEAFLQVENISVLEFGPSHNFVLIGCINALPATTTKKITDKSEREIIEENITKGSWNFISNSAIHQQGFPALDYLLFSEGAIDKFSAPNAASRKKYVNDVLARIKLLLDQTTSTWKNSYRAEFISNTKSNSGSPISYLLNQFSYEMDMIKGPRIGWPYGTMSGGTQFPEWVEGYYADISLDLAIENMKSLKTMFNGGGSGKGISDLLNALGHTKLTNDILTQFESVDKKLKAIPAPLSKSLSTNKKQIDEALAEIQLLLKLIKTEATSKLGVQISYVDNDGD